MLFKSFARALCFRFYLHVFLQRMVYFLLTTLLSGIGVRKRNVRLNKLPVQIKQHSCQMFRWGTIERFLLCLCDIYIVYAAQSNFTNHKCLELIFSCLLFYFDFYLTLYSINQSITSGKKSWSTSYQLTSIFQHLKLFYNS